MAKKIQKLDKRSHRKSDNQDLREQIKVYQGLGVIQNEEGKGEEED